MDPKIIVPLIGLATAVVGAVTAALGRKKEIVHRHRYGPDETKRSFSVIGCVGLLIAVGGLLLVVSALIPFFLLVPVHSGSGADKKDAAVKAWTDAGAQCGWMHTADDGNIEFSVVEGAAGEVLAFAFVEEGRWKDGALMKLPDPGEPFGLWLSCSATDVGLKGVDELKNLHTLSLGQTQITDVGLKELRGLKNLQSLGLQQTTDVGLRELAGLDSLETLDLTNTNVTDAGLRELVGLRRLKTLKLRFTNVTDAGLEDLARLQSLKCLDLTFTKVTKTGVAALHQELPTCKIYD